MARLCCKARICWKARMNQMKYSSHVVYRYKSLTVLEKKSSRTSNIKKTTDTRSFHPRAPPQPPGRMLWAACGNAGRHSWCARCLRVRYCSEACQRQHWHVHRRLCQEPNWKHRYVWTARKWGRKFLRRARAWGSRAQAQRLVGVWKARPWRVSRRVKRRLKRWLTSVLGKALLMPLLSRSGCGH